MSRRFGLLILDCNKTRRHALDFNIETSCVIFSELLKYNVTISHLTAGNVTTRMILFCTKTQIKLSLYIRISSSQIVTRGILD